MSFDFPITTWCNSYHTDTVLNTNMFLEVVNNLFLGDKNTARNYSEIEKAGVSLVVSVGGGCLQLPGGVETVRLHV